MDECLQPRERPHPRAEGLPELVVAAAGSRAGFCCAVHAIASSAAAHGCLRATETRRRASVLSWRRAVERGARRHRSEPSKDGASASASASDEGQALGLPLRPLCHHDPSPGAAAAAGQAVPKGISNLKHEYKLNTTANDDKVSVALIWSRCFHPLARRARRAGTEARGYVGAGPRALLHAHPRRTVANTFPRRPFSSALRYASDACTACRMTRRRRAVGEKRPLSRCLSVLANASEQESRLPDT